LASAYLHDQFTKFSAVLLYLPHSVTTFKHLLDSSWTTASTFNTLQYYLRALFFMI